MGIYKFIFNWGIRKGFRDEGKFGLRFVVLIG